MARHRWDPIAPAVRVTHPRRVGADGPTRGAAARSRWRRTGWGAYVPSTVDDDQVEQRIVEEAARLPCGGAVTGWAACRLAGAAFFDGLARDGRTPMPVALAVGPRGGVRRHPGITVSFERLPAWEIGVRYGVSVVRPERAVFDEMRRRSRDEALVALEAAFAGRITSLPRMRAYAATHGSARRVDRVEWALARACEHVRSPQESRLRILAQEEADYPHLLVNRVVLGPRGERVGEVDLLDAEAGVVLEFDGRDHRDGPQQAWDITKEEALRAVGLEVARVAGSQLRDRLTLALRLRAVRARARWEPPTTRAWSIARRDVDLESALQERELAAMWAADLPPAASW